MRLRIGYRLADKGNIATVLAAGVVVAVTFWTLGVATMPALVPALSSSAYWWMAAAGTAGLIVSLFLPAVVAGTIAGPAGGAWGREALAALSAALAALGVGIFLLLLVFQASGPQTPLTTVGVGFFLGLANFALAVLALLPVYPLPGGRAVYALLEGRMSPRRARRWAVVPTLVLGAGAVAFGMWTLATSGMAAGLWLL